MAARTTRREARERIIKSFMESLDKIIPAEESVPLRGQTFMDWERQADALRKAVVPTLLQERAALDPGAEVEAGHYGNCPRCGSDNLTTIRWSRYAAAAMLFVPLPLFIWRNRVKCRSCGNEWKRAAA